MLKKIICFILIVVSIFSLSACGNKSETSLLTSENKSKLFPEGSKIENLRLNSMDYSQFKDNNEGFNLVGNSKDKDESDFIYKQMKEIGLKNVEQVPITIDGWDLGDLSMTFKCDCMDTGYMNVYELGVYPCDFSFKGEKYQVLYVDSLLNYNESLIGKGVLIDIDKYKEMPMESEKAKELGAKFVIFVDKESNLLIDVKLDLSINVPKDLPIFVISESTLRNIKDNLDEMNQIEVEISGHSKLKKDVESSFIVGELKGKSSSKYIYITANRDSFFNGFYGSNISISELLSIAEHLINDDYKPKYTIRFLVTTGHEWGSIDGGFNIGLKKYLETINTKKVKYALVLDGCKPIEKSVLQEFQCSDNKLIEDVSSILKSLKTTETKYLTVTSDISNSRITEAEVWSELGVKTILQAEPMTSEYYDIENSSADTASIVTNGDYVNELMLNILGIIKGLK